MKWPKNKMATCNECGVTDRSLTVQVCALQSENAVLDERLAALEKAALHGSSKSTAATTSSASSNIVRMFDRGESVIINQVSGLVLGIVSMAPMRVIVISFFIWMMSDRIARYWLASTALLKDNDIVFWREMITAMLYFTRLVGIFIVVQKFLEVYKNVIQSSGMSVFESILAVFLIMVTVCFTINCIKDVARTPRP